MDASPVGSGLVGSEKAHPRDVALIDHTLEPVITPVNCVRTPTHYQRPVIRFEITTVVARTRSMFSDTGMPIFALDYRSTLDLFPANRD